MVSFTSTTVAVIAAISLAQPIAAGPAALIGTAISTVAGLVANHKRGDTSIWARDDSIQSEFASCMSAAHQGTPPKMTINADKTVDMTGLPAICISELNTYNSQPNIQAMNAAQGKATVTGPNSIHIDGMPDHFTSYLESFAQGNAPQANKPAGGKKQN
jgi:hypothetical protein